MNNKFETSSRARAEGWTQSQSDRYNLDREGTTIWNILQKLNSVLTLVFLGTFAVRGIKLAFYYKKTVENNIMYDIVLGITVAVVAAMSYYTFIEKTRGRDKAFKVFNGDFFGGILLMQLCVMLICGVLIVVFRIFFTGDAPTAVSLGALIHNLVGIIVGLATMAAVFLGGVFSILIFAVMILCNVFLTLESVFGTMTPPCSILNGYKLENGLLAVVAALPLAAGILMFFWK